MHTPYSRIDEPDRSTVNRASGGKIDASPRNSVRTEWHQLYRCPRMNFRRHNPLHGKTAGG